jgi:hypothetical protein
MADDFRPQSRWQNFAGVLTTIAAVVGAAAGLSVALGSEGPIRTTHYLLQGKTDAVRDHRYFCICVTCIRRDLLVISPSAR